MLQNLARVIHQHRAHGLFHQRNFLLDQFNGVTNARRRFMRKRMRLAGNHRALIGVAQSAPRWNLNHKSKSIRKRWIKRLAAQVTVRGNVIGVGRRIHGRPSKSQLGQLHSLHFFLVNNGKKPVQHVRTRARNFINEHGLRVPHRRGSLHKCQRSIDVGQRISNQVVVVHQACVVVTPLQTKRLAQPTQQ